MSSERVWGIAPVFDGTDRNVLWRKSQQAEFTFLRIEGETRIAEDNGKRKGGLAASSIEDWRESKKEAGGPGMGDGPAVVG